MPQTWSPPSSPEPFDNAVISTNSRGMITDPNHSPSPSKENGVKSAKRKRRAVTHVSRHFAEPPKELKKEPRAKRKRTSHEDKENVLNQPEGGAPNVDVEPERTEDVTHPRRLRAKRAKVADASAVDLEKAVKDERDGYAPGAVQSNATRLQNPTVDSISKSSHTLPQTKPRIVLGVNIDELSSDSDLTDVPDDIGPDPFLSTPRTKKGRRSRKDRSDAELVAVKEPVPKSKAKKSSLTKSPYFPHPHKPRPTFLSTLPFPPLHHARFGLMQERLHRDPFRLLLATIFLNKTPGARAMPIFFRLMERYPAPQDLANAVQADVTEIIHELGFQNQRARKCIAMAQMWVQEAPVKGRRWRKMGYPMKGDGKDVKEGESIADEDERVAWEISKLPGLGPYSHDSWRMFCRDQLRGLSSGYNGEDSEHGFEPEWKRVLPADKELRAWMTWMWMKEGWVWNKETGERTKASEELMALANAQGNVVLESDNNTLMVKSLDDSKPSTAQLREGVKKDMRVEVPAGDFIFESQTDNG